VDADADGLPDLGYGDCRTHLDPDVTDTQFVDTETPAAGYFYVVGFFDGTNHRGLGNTSQGRRRSVTSPCP